MAAAPGRRRPVAPAGSRREDRREGVLKVRLGLGFGQLPFADVRAFWRFVERCEASDLDSLWQTDRLVSSVPQLEPLRAAS